jgi:hypothetical protein
MKKSDIPIIAEVTGVVAVTAGIAMLSIPLALIALGSFLVWITEKNNG